MNKAGTMIKVTLDEHVRQCDHCTAKNIKRTFHIQSDDYEMYIGRICIQNITGVNTSGNPHRARASVEDYLNRLGEDDVNELISWLCSGGE